MSPHELARVSPHQLSEFLRKSLMDKDYSSAADAFTQIESRFEQGCSTMDGSRTFVDDFLPLADSPEIRALHVGEVPVRLAARLEHLLELAGTRARAVTDDAVLRQIVDARDRGMDLLKVLAAAPKYCLIAGELAKRLAITPQNLSPLLSAFHAHGLVDREKRSRNVFVTLMRQGRALLPETEVQPAVREEVEPRFLHEPLVAHKAWAA
jgi:DNA-binding transcriptional ArsR family regulator